MVATKEQDSLRAAACYESALRVDPADGKSRTNLQHTLRHLFNPTLVVFGDRAMNEQVQQACNLAQHRSYASAAGAMGRLRAVRPDAVRLTFMQASAKLLACYSGHEEFLGEALDLFDVLEALHPDWQEPRQGWVTSLEFAERDCGVVGLLALSRYEAKRGQFGESCRLMHFAVARAQSGAAAPTMTKRTVDPLAGKSESLTRQILEEFTAWLHQRRDDFVEVPFLKGLTALLECHAAIRRTGLVGPGWLPAVKAVHQLELALCQSPDRADIVAHFQQAVDTFSGIASAMLNEMDPDQLHFFQNTYDAAVQNLIPESPLNRIVQPGSSPLSLRQICENAYRKLFESSRTPLRGEFLVAPLELHYVLTNYRLLLLTDRLPLPQLLPLNGVNRYSSRSSGLNVSTVIIGLPEGKQLIFNNLPNGAIPKDSLVSYLIAARMWERLKPFEQHVLVTGHTQNAADMLPGAEQVAPHALPGMATQHRSQGSFEIPPRVEESAAAGVGFCSNCGNAVQATDLFCRQCGNRMTAAPPLDPARMLGSGGP